MAGPDFRTIEDAERALGAGETTSVALTEATLAKIEAREPTVNALISLTAERALADARVADERRAAGETTPLLGIPIVLKDIFATAGLRTTCASKILEQWVPPYDADATTRLGKAGAVLVGKANMDEFAMGSSNENSAFGPTRNPWDLDRVPGGSSGGSAAAVAAEECLGAFGTDTGGSIRLPASYCGVVGLKPTYGRCSRFGVIAYASSLDQVGPFARTARDAASLLQVVAGHDPRDSTSASREVPNYASALSGDLQGVRVGVPSEYFVDGLAPSVERATREAIDVLRARGAQIVDVSLPHTPYAVATYYLIGTAEASSNLARYDGVKYGLRAAETGELLDMYRETRDRGFGHEVKRRILLGTYALSAGYYDAYYLKAQKVRTLIRQDFESAFQSCDLIASPTAATTAFRLGERSDDPIAMYLTDIFTVPANLAGLPGLSVPCGFDDDGLPIGLQILAPAFGEASALRAADAFQRDTTFHTQRPPGLEEDAR